MLENFVFLQIYKVDGFIFQQDEAPPHYALNVLTEFNNRFLGR